MKNYNGKVLSHIQELYDASSNSRYDEHGPTYNRVKLS